VSVGGLANRSETPLEVCPRGPERSREFDSCHEFNKKYGRINRSHRPARLRNAHPSPDFLARSFSVPFQDIRGVVCAVKLEAQNLRLSSGSSSNKRTAATNSHTVPTHYYFENKTQQALITTKQQTRGQTTINRFEDEHKRKTTTPQRFQTVRRHNVSRRRNASAIHKRLEGLEAYWPQVTRKME
jgi:hypothetical protein